MISSVKTVAVVGGGIGGMAAATALAQAGLHVTLYERAPVLGEVGAGIQISRNGQTVLEALGISPKPSEMVVSGGTRFYSGWSGRSFARVRPARVGATWYMHRADLLACLGRAATAAGVQFRLGTPVEPGGVDADLIVAADGMKSAWRDHVTGAVTRAVFKKAVAWRATVPGDFAGQTETTLTLGAGGHVVTYPLRGGQLLNVVAIEDRDDWAKESWASEGDLAEYHIRFARFGGPAHQAILAAEKVHRWALHLRPVAPVWSRENVVLLGDAAHTTLPFMAQGACLALEDALVLARVLAAKSELDEALRAYEAMRNPRTQQVVKFSAGNGWRFHMPRPFAWGAQAVLAVGAPVLERQLRWIYDHDAARESIP